MAGRSITQCKASARLKRLLLVPAIKGDIQNTIDYYVLTITYRAVYIDERSQQVFYKLRRLIKLQLLFMQCSTRVCSRRHSLPAAVHS